ncbi:MAG TPA: septation protein A [Gammaproteobacteria bacterium]|nr:septation protein A [Gammaproteobacteria bacterium]
MQFLYEFLPVLLFFLAFKFYHIYVATVVGIAATAIQAAIHRLWFKRWDKKQLITFSVFLFFGSMTLYFHNPIFVKWKPTVVLWIFALLLMGSQLFTRKPLMQRFMEGVLQDKGNVPVSIWRRINIMWIVFFVALGGFNLYFAYYFSDDVWVNFKFYGITGALFLFSLLQAIYLARYLNESKTMR